MQRMSIQCRCTFSMVSQFDFKCNICSFFYISLLIVVACICTISWCTVKYFPLVVSLYSIYLLDTLITMAVIRCLIVKIKINFAHFHPYLPRDEMKKQHHHQLSLFLLQQEQQIKCKQNNNQLNKWHMW